LNLQVFLEPSFFRRFHHCVIGVLVLGVVDHAGDNGNIIRQHRTARVDLSVSERQCLAFRFWVGDDERFPLFAYLLVAYTRKSITISTRRSGSFRSKLLHHPLSVFLKRTRVNV